MKELQDTDALFSNYKYSHHATDVIFQQAFRSSWNMQEGKFYYSGKHKLYGYKVEVSVLLNGLLIGCTSHYFGSVCDVSIFQENQHVHKQQVKKSREERESARIMGSYQLITVATGAYYWTRVTQDLKSLFMVLCIKKSQQIARCQDRNSNAMIACQVTAWLWKRLWAYVRIVASDWRKVEMGWEDVWRLFHALNSS